MTRRWSFDRLVLTGLAVLACISAGSLALAQRLAKAGDERLWSEV